MMTEFQEEKKLFFFCVGNMQFITRDEIVYLENFKNVYTYRHIEIASKTDKNNKEIENIEEN